jgi:hypothetical protein
VSLKYFVEKKAYRPWMTGDFVASALIDNAALAMPTMRLADPSGVTS